MSARMRSAEAEGGGEMPKKTECPLKLFVWVGFAPDYSDGLAFAIAQDEAQARRLVIQAYLNGCEPGTWGELTVKSLKEPTAFAVGGGG